jgi:hypothetical protein
VCGDDERLLVFSYHFECMIFSTRLAHGGGLRRCCTTSEFRVESMTCVDLNVFAIHGSYRSLDHTSESSRASTSPYTSLSTPIRYTCLNVPFPYTGSVIGNVTSAVGSTGNDTFAVGITGSDTFPVGSTGKDTFKVGVTGIPTGTLVMSSGGFPPKSHG